MGSFLGKREGGGHSISITYIRLVHESPPHSHPTSLHAAPFLVFLLLSLLLLLLLLLPTCLLVRLPTAYCHCY